MAREGHSKSICSPLPLSLLLIFHLWDFTWEARPELMSSGMFGEAGKAGWEVWSWLASPPSADENENIKNKSPEPRWFHSFLCSCRIWGFPWISAFMTVPVTGPAQRFSSPRISHIHSPAFPGSHLSFSRLAGAFVGKLFNPGVQIPAGIGFV